MNIPDRFIVRAYGLWMADNKLLCTREYQEGGDTWFKFPGGGLEFGEGLRECLEREFKEETGVTLVSADLYYINDFYQVSRFNPGDQLISAYFMVQADEMPGKLHHTEMRNGNPYHAHLEWWDLMEL